MSWSPNSDELHMLALVGRWRGLNEESKPYALRVFRRLLNPYFGLKSRKYAGEVKRQRSDTYGLDSECFRGWSVFVKCIK